MSFIKKEDITAKCDDIDDNSHNKRRPTYNLKTIGTNSATTSAQQKDITVADIQTFEFSETTLKECSQSCSQTTVESSDNENNELIVEQIEVKPILKRKSLDETEIKTLPSILKKRDSFDFSSKQTILKRHSLGSETDQRNPSLLFNTSAVHEIDISSTPSSSCRPSSQIHSILKHKSFDEKFIQSKDDQNFPKPILKKNLSIEESIEKNLSLKNGTNGVNSSKTSPSHSTNNSTKSILKSGSEENKIFTNKSVEVKSILKTGLKNDSKPVKSALKKSDQNLDTKDSKVKSILKSESIGSNEEINTSDTNSSSGDEDFDLDHNLSQSNDSIESNINNNNNSTNNHNTNGNSIPTPNTCALKQNDENKANQRYLLNNKKLDQKRPSSCIIMSTTKPIDIDIEGEDSKKSEATGHSISDRLAALKRNGEENWKKRVSKSGEPEVQLRVNASNSCNLRNRATSIADRLSLLEDSSLKWKNRVGETDAKKFTIEAKMQETETPVDKTPDVQRKTPKAMAFRSEKTAQLLNSIKKEPMVVPKLKVTESETQKQLDPSPKKLVEVSIPKSDDDNFNSFFGEKKALNKCEALSDDVFDVISTGVSDLLIQKKPIKTHNRRTGSNPIRRLAARTDFTVDSYTESTAQLNDSNSNEIKPKKPKDSSFAASALAGLASREDIKAVAGKLRSSSVGTRDVWKSYDMPNSMQNLMLVQIKGRRRAQTRLVEPTLDSINSGDSYILVSKEHVFAWIGQYSNIIEKTKTMEIMNQIQEKKDLCFRSSNDVILIDCQKTEKNQKKSNQLFLKELKSSESHPIKPPKPPEEDEVYEEAIIGTNMIYHVNNEQLVPNDDYWGRVPKYEMLTSDEAFVFDFGPEMYVWVGNKASNIKRKCALDSAKDLWNKGYDYTECDVNPLGEKAPKKAEKRPHWGWFMKVSQNMETVLFKDKFMNWPSAAITAANTTSAKSTPNEKRCPKPFHSEIDAKALIDAIPPEPDMILEASHLGRGVRWDDDLEGRHISITSLDVKCWQISEYEKHELLDENKFCFYSGDTIVVRWHYRLSRGGRLLKTGDISRHSMIGRDRICYFFWHGINTKNTEKGASALMTVEMDKEKAQQVRVSERKEEPCFLNMFKGGLIILRGKRGQKSSSVWKMFYVRGVLPNEATLIEVECRPQSLRSRTAFVFVNPSSHLIYVWSGSKCLEETREVMNRAVHNLTVNKSPEIGLKSDVNYSVKQLEEGKECHEFWHIFSLDDKTDDYRSLYYSLLDSCDSHSYTPRLFHLTSTSGDFKPKEILSSFRSNDAINPYPFLEEDIYGAQQPTFFLFDNNSQIFLWESKFAFSMDPIEESEANQTIGSVNIRWNNERKHALEFALSYCHAKNSCEPPNAHLICAGLEPDSFCALFPEWKYREDVALIHIQDGRKASAMVPIQEILAQLSNADSTHYSLQELRKKPEELNPLCLESYLSAEDFKEALGISREEFYGLPAWKQTSLKQRAHLF